jgi:hypothetical protein
MLKLIAFSVYRSSRTDSAEEVEPWVSYFNPRGKALKRGLTNGEVSGLSARRLTPKRPSSTPSEIQPWFPTSSAQGALKSCFDIHS